MAVMAELQPTVVVQVQTSAEVGAAAEVVTLWAWNRYEVGAEDRRLCSVGGACHAHMVVVANSDALSGFGLSVGAYLARNQGIVVLCALR